MADVAERLAQSLDRQLRLLTRRAVRPAVVQALHALHSLASLAPPPGLSSAEGGAAAAAAAAASATACGVAAARAWRAAELGATATRLELRQAQRRQRLLLIQWVHAASLPALAARPGAAGRAAARALRSAELTAREAARPALATARAESEAARVALEEVLPPHARARDELLTMLAAPEPEARRGDS